MNYYMLHGLLNDDYIYVNPKKDFEKMMNMEGAGEYWQSLLLTVFPLIQKIKLSY